MYVFVGGRYAGALSPQVMTPGTDASAGAVRFTDDGITVEFARYKPGDSTCCPTSRVAVRYRIDRSDVGPVVVPVDVRTTRSSNGALRDIFSIVTPFWIGTGGLFGWVCHVIAAYTAYRRSGIYNLQL